MKNNIAISVLKQRFSDTSKNLITRWANPHNKPAVASLYIHIPFCFHKCHYCDFYSIVDRQDRQEAFLARMIDELRAQSLATGHPSLQTIFIGGGTPTLLAPRLLKELTAAIQMEFDLSTSTEWTIESNPETLTNEICDVLAQSGINRISMGAQTFNTTHLKTLERHHDPESVERSIRRAKAAGLERLSLDLIYAIPGQTLDQWADDLSRALALPIDHLSAYALTYEPNTAMTARLKRGEFNATPDELEVEMYNHTLNQIQAQGMKRYEVSNHAKPGSQCRHNLAYWQGENWLAVGPSAAGHLDGIRWKNTPRLEEYLNTSDEGFAPICEHETPNQRRMLMDWMMMGIRISQGLGQQELLRRANELNRADQIVQVMNMCIDQGWVKLENDHWSLTDSGFHFADRVARDLIGALIED
ncbi:MAG: radical SAM family heme chaperone HemW [Phycisphaerales bacterium]|nr:radical SAM family heme chaperone HemW [Phycisphaerales bacterium]